jgi:(p)ppGpp synthase/HD superfamily hydrolase
MATFEKAISIAVKAHEGQQDKAGAVYILHPLRMMLKMESEADMIVAVLHDVVEDSALTLDDLRQQGFPQEVLDAIDSLTRRAGESYAAFIERAGRNPIARRVKLADLEDNMNITRMGTLSDKDLERLKRYHEAWLLLTRSKIE